MMPIYTVQAPDGRKIKVEAASPDIAIQGAQEWAAANPAQSKASAAPSDAPPAGAKPGSREYADWALSRAKAGLSIPQVSPRPPEFGGTQDLVGAIQGGYTKALDSVPIIGPSLLAGAENAKAALYGVDPALIRAETQANQVMNPEAALTGAVAGTVLPLVAAGGTALGGRLLGMTGSVPAQIGMGAASSGLLSGADTLARGGTWEDSGKNALLGAAIGGAVPAIGSKVADAFRGMAQNKAITQAVANAPAASELKSTASALFDTVDNAGVQVAPNAFATEVADLVQKAQKLRMNPTLDAKATGAFQELVSAAQEAMAGKALSFGDLHNLRQIAQKAAVSSEGRDAMFANMIVDSIDKFITKPGAAITPNGPATGNTLLEAISTWGRAKRVGLIEEAIYKAGNVASGFENGIRIEFRKILQNPKLRKQFSDIEIKEIERVVQGTPGANLLKLIGKFGFSPSGNGLGGFLGGTAGLAVGGPIGAAVTAAGASGARALAERATEKAAERAAKVVATPNIPVLPKLPYQGYIPPALLPLLSN